MREIPLISRFELRSARDATRAACIDTRTRTRAHTWTRRWFARDNAAYTLLRYRGGSHSRMSGRAVIIARLDPFSMINYPGARD